MDQTSTFRRRPFPLYLVLALTFLAGVYAERGGWLPGAGGHEPPGLGATFHPFWEAWHLVEKHYVDREAIKPVRMTQFAIAGMIQSLGDTGHTTYLPPEEFQRLKAGLKGELEGIGARVTQRNGQPVIFQTMPGSPARAAGLRPGDVLLEVDGNPVAHLPLEQVVTKVRGPAGTSVHLEVQRPGQDKSLEFTIARAKVEVTEVSWHLLPGTDVAHVALIEFGLHAGDQLAAALKEARAGGARALILDLRGNPGGVKDQAVAVASQFLASGTVFLEQDAQGQRTEVPVRAGGLAKDIPLCVLIDGGTASASEIVAGALQDAGRAVLVGTRTFGTGTVLEPFVLSDNSAVMLAVSEWLTPKGRQIWHKGITPDAEVELPQGAYVLVPDAEAGMDPSALARSEDKQLLRALEVLREIKR